MIIAAATNESLAEMSNVLIYSSMAVYTLAFLAHIAEWVLGSRSKVGRTAAALTEQPAAAPAELVVDALQLTNTFGPEYRMLLIGAGQLAEYLATMALFSGFAVTVCDPREEYRGAWNVPGATVVSDMPDDVVRAFRADRRTCVVALTHDPKLDDPALKIALPSPAFYVGALGSKTTQAKRRQRLLVVGLARQHLAVDRDRALHRTHAALAQRREPQHEADLLLGIVGEVQLALHVVGQLGPHALLFIQRVERGQREHRRVRHGVHGAQAVGRGLRDVPGGAGDQASR